ncbi:hypothetical protein K8I61_09505, partial [bacterium]|nr:hypothetical protein [bacterium]
MLEHPHKDPAADLEPARSEIELEVQGARLHAAEISSMSWSFDLSIEAFLHDPRNFTRFDPASLHLEHAPSRDDFSTWKEVVWAGTKDFLSKWENRALVGLILLFVLLLFMINPDVVRTMREIEMLPPILDTPTP